MLFNKKYIVFVINISAILCNASTQMTKSNETNEFLSIRLQLADLKTDQDNNNCCIHHRPNHWRNCADAIEDSQSSGIYEIHIPSYIQHPFRVACDATTQGDGWTIILSRMDGSVDFYRNWKSYRKGFGLLDGEFFLGLDKIHALTAEVTQELLVVLEDFEGIKVFEKYEKFAIGDEDEDYALYMLGKANGTAGDSLRQNHGQQFYTFDRGTDNGHYCAGELHGAWWYKSCTNANLAGKYNGTNFQGITWYNFRQGTSLKRATMMIRPRISLCK